MHQFGKFINELNGRYITAFDSGTLLSDMDIIAEHTHYIASLSKYNGDPSPSTAKGILRGIQAAVAFKLGKENLKGHSCCYSRSGPCRLFASQTFT